MARNLDEWADEHCFGDDDADRNDADRAAVRLGYGNRADDLDEGIDLAVEDEGEE